jgi:hypothetical protein
MKTQKYSKIVRKDHHQQSGTLKPSRLKIEYLPLEQITRNPLNPREHRPGQLKKLEHIMWELGCNTPLLLDRHKNLLAGHTRFEACKRPGLSHDLSHERG